MSFKILNIYIGKNRKKSSRQFRCNLCGQKYKILGWMKQHMKVKHPTEAADDFTETAQGINSGLDLPFFVLEVLFSIYQ